MTASTLLEILTQAPFILIFYVVAIQAARSPRRATIDTALFFGVISLVIVIDWVAEALRRSESPAVSTAKFVLIVTLPYLLLRLVDDFSDVPRLLLRGAEVGLIVLAASFIGFGTPRPLWLLLLLAFYFFGLNIYAAIAFIREAGRSHGVAQRRMRAVAAGSIFLGLTIVVVGVGAAIPMLPELVTGGLLRSFTLAGGLGYYLGFAPPILLRRAWQEPEVRRFLAQAARLPRLPDTAAIIDELTHGVTSSFGASNAAIGLWHEEDQRLRFSRDGRQFDLGPGEMLAGRAFATKRALFSSNAARDDPAHADVYRAYGATAVLAAPITAGEKRLGVLVTYTSRASLFSEDDLLLAQLLADQCAVVLESRALIDEMLRVRAREETTRLKDDFLSAAAHDLKTPLTTLVAQAELLDLRAARQPDAPADRASLQRLVKEAHRLRTLVLELLDAARVEEGRLVGAREAVDLGALAGEVCERLAGSSPCRVVTRTEPVIGLYDRTRVTQLVENLIENALKYSPDGGEVRVEVWREGDEAHLTVTDNGIGIPPGDLPHVFDRFYRGANVDDRRFAGMGLGLYICQGIAEQHGGRITASSTPGQGSTFHVTLPLTPSADAPADEPLPDETAATTTQVHRD